MRRARVKDVVRNPIVKSNGSLQPFLGLEDIEGGTGRLLVDELPLKAAEDSVQHLAGDVLFSKLRPYLTKAYFATRPGTATGELLVLRPSQLVNPRFLFYVTLSKPWVEWANATAYGTKMPRTAWELLSEYRMMLPSPTEQRRIANFLDAETGRIDKLLTLRTATLSLVREQTDAYLDATTRGGVTQGGKLADYAPLGRIPQTWRQGRLRSVSCDVQTGPFGSQLHAEDYIKDGWPVVNPASIHPKGLVADANTTVSDRVRERLARHILRTGDVVFGRRGELGRAALVSQAQDGWICGTGSLRIRFHKQSFHAGYLRRFLQIPAVRHYFQIQSIGSTMANLNTSILLNMPLLFPDLKEQHDIARKCDDIEQSSQKRERIIERQLTVLAERRQALITAAVTGQIDVSTASGRGIED